RREGAQAQGAERTRRQTKGFQVSRTGGGEPAEQDAKDENKENPGKEGRHALAGQSQGGERPLKPTASPYRHGEANRNANADSDRKGASCKQDGVGNARGHDVEGRDALDDGDAKVKVRERTQVVDVLRDHRPIEAELGAQGVDVFLRGTFRNQE